MLRGRRYDPLQSTPFVNKGSKTKPLAPQLPPFLNVFGYLQVRAEKSTSIIDSAGMSGK
jgi:hypothetical protein